MTATDSPTTHAAAPYVPGILRSWGEESPRHRQVVGSLVSADISGFTALSERLASFGREGAEELTVLLNRCFGGMIGIVEDHYGDVLKFGGDALLILFTGEDHALRAAAACYRMRAFIERDWSTPLVKSVRLGISQGMHSGTFDLHLVDAGYQELLVVGPGMTSTVSCEGDAERGEILVSADTAALLDPFALGPARDGAQPLMADVGPWIGLDQPVTGDGDIVPYVPSWLVEQATTGVVAEHRVVTVAFIFFGGLDAVLSTQGPSAAHARLEQLAQVIRDAAEMHGTYWLASDVYPGGGKVILAAGAPRSTGQDEDAAVRTLSHILDSELDLALRVGVNRGPVFMGDLGSEQRRTFTVMGDTVNLAARLMQKSQVGQMVASSAVLDAVPTRFELTELEPFLVKGKTEPIHAALVGQRVDAEHSAEPRLETGDDVPFVGRQAELRVLHHAMVETERGRGHVIDLVGEPGIGKTRLVAEALRGFPDMGILRTSGGLYSRTSPYFAVRNLLRDAAGIDRSASSGEAGIELGLWLREVAPELVPWTPLLAVAFDAEATETPEVARIKPENRALKIRTLVAELLGAVLVDPVLIVVEDSYWLDEASDGVFAELSARAKNHPWLLISLRRVDTDCFASNLPAANVLHLGELKPEDTRALATAAITAGLGSDLNQVEDILDRGATNPLFLLELVRAGATDSTPDSIEALVTARIDTLASSDRRLLREGAVLGAVVDVELLAEVMDDPRLSTRNRWEPLNGFLQREADGSLRFQHALYRDVAYEGLSFRRRQQLHADVGTVLERRAGGAWAEASELLSLHFHAARDWTRAWRYSVTAGDRAREKYANKEASVFYERALSARGSARPNEAVVARVYESLGDVLELSARFDDANEAFTLARRHNRDQARSVRLLRKEGVIRERHARYSQALRWYGRGLKEAANLTDAHTRLSEEGELCLAYSGVRFRQGRLDSCLEWAHRAEGIARELDDRGMLAHSSYLLMIGYGVLRRPEANRYRDLALPLFEELGDPVGQANVLNNLGVDAKDAGDWVGALDLYERSREARDQAGDLVGAATASLNIGEILSDQGHLDEAEELLSDAHRSFERVAYPIGVAVTTSYLGRLEARRGNADQGRRLLADALEMFNDMGASHFALETRAFQLEAEVLAGNGVAAVAEAGEVYTQARDLGDDLILVTLLRIQAWAQHQVGELAEAERVVNEAIELAESIDSAIEIALALIVRGQIMAATGRDRRPDHARARELLTSLGVVALPEIAKAPS